MADTETPYETLLLNHLGQKPARILVTAPFQKRCARLITDITNDGIWELQTLTRAFLQNPGAPATAANTILHLNMDGSHDEEVMDAALDLGVDVHLPCMLSLVPDVSDHRGYKTLCHVAIDSVENLAAEMLKPLELAPSAEGEIPENSTAATGPDPLVAAGAAGAQGEPEPAVENLRPLVQALLSGTTGDACVRLHIAGDKTHCGKTTVALGILGALYRAGVPVERIAYIKPATQCEAPDLMLKWCEAKGITYVGGPNAPLVYYKGFTRDFIAGNQGTSADWIEQIAAAVDDMAKTKSFVLVDGVGFPGVGSCVGVSNAEVAKASRAPTVLVGKSGVGSAIDSYCLNATFFLSAGVPVLGGIFNFGALDGFYRYDIIEEQIVSFMGQQRSREHVYGVLPDNEYLKDVREKISEMTPERLLELAEINISHVVQFMDVASLILHASLDPWNRDALPLAALLGAAGAHPPPVPAAAHTAPARISPPAHTPAPKRVAKPKVDRRAEIEAKAKAKGASGG